MKVRGGNTTSSSFKVGNGVRQGSIFSPVLFNIYMDNRGCAFRWPEATQTAVEPAKAIFWLALLASHNFVQALTLFLF